MGSGSGTGSGVSMKSPSAGIVVSCGSRLVSKEMRTSSTFRVSTPS